MNDNQLKSDNYNQKGIEAADRKWMEEAILAFKKAIELEYDYPDAHVNLGAYHAETGNREEAIRSFRAAIELDPDDLDARYELAAALIGQDNHVEAIRELKRIAKIAPERGDVWIELGNAYAAQGFYEIAEQYFQKAAEFDEAYAASRASPSSKEPI
jgi:tetratricopeptide (TPR) repeat protein